MENVTFLGAFREMWVRIFDYKGVSGRKQYWFPFALHCGIALLVSCLVLASLMAESGGLFFFLGASALVGYLVLSIIPWISLTVRRLRDAGRSGLWTLPVLILGAGLIILLLLCTSASTIYRNSLGNSGFDPVANVPEQLTVLPE